MTNDERSGDSLERINLAVATCLAADPADRERVLSALEPAERVETEHLLKLVGFALGQMPGPLHEGLVVDGRYELRSELGAGGFGRVWSAQDRRVDKEVAIKFIRLPLHSSSDPEELFENERSALARIDRPGIARILDCGRLDDQFYLVMDLITGRTVCDAVEVLRKGRDSGDHPPSGEALRAAIEQAKLAGDSDLTSGPSWHHVCARIVTELLAALEAVHAAGVVHLDIHTSNVVLRGGGHPVLLDFGISVLRREDLTPTDAFRGSLAYMDPEQIRQGRNGHDPRTDVYQVGLVLYELLTLEPVFAADGNDELPMRVRQGDFRPPRAIDPAIPRHLEAICLRALANEPGQRFQSAAEFREELDGWLRGVAAPEAEERFEVLETLVEDPRFVRFRAYDRHYECEVILEQVGKVLREQLTVDLRDKALREARAIAKIQHPNVARLKGDLVEFRGLPTLVIEPIQGEGLDALLEREGRLPPEQVIRIGRELAQAALALHVANVVHRGISAESVVISSDDGRAILRGFTFAKPIADRLAPESLMHRNREKGSAAEFGLPAYAAPEQMRGESAEQRSDVFALGCLLYRCATGEEASPEWQLEYKPPTPAAGVAPEVPKNLSAVIQQCLAASATQRMKNMAVVDEQLAGCEVPAERTSTKQGNLLARRFLQASAAAILLAAAWVVSRPGDVDDFAPEGAYVLPDLTPRDNAPIFEPSYSNRRALLVGTNYAGSQIHAVLKNAESDVTRIHGILTRLGWQQDEVRVLRGPEATREQILDDLRWARENDVDGQTLVYFAGHGELDGHGGSHGFFIPHDGGSTETNWVDLRRIVDPLEQVGGPKHMLVALDCCHAGAAIPAIRGESRPARDAEESVPLDRMTNQNLRRTARVLLTSALATEKANDNSPFAAGFVSALEEGLAGQPVTTSLIYARIHRAFVDAKARQCCWRTDFNFGGTDFVFLPKN